MLRNSDSDSDSRVYKKSMIPIPIPVASDSDSDFSVSKKPWFRYWFRFQHHMIPTPIPKNQALIPILIPESYSDSGIIYNSDYHLDFSHSSIIDFQQFTCTNTFLLLPGLKFVDSLSEISLLLITWSSVCLLSLSSADWLVSLSFFVWLIEIGWLIWAISSSLGLGLGSVTCWQIIGSLVEE